MAIIDNLPVLASLQGTDEIPVERGTTTYKASVNTISAAAANYASIQIGSSATWADVYAAIQTIAVFGCATFFCDSGFASTLSGGAFSGSLKGIINNQGSGAYDIFAYVGGGNAIGCWRVSGHTSSSATPTVGTVYRYYPGRVPVESGSVSVSSATSGSYTTKAITFANAQTDTSYMIETECSVCGFVTSVRDKTTTGCNLVIGNLRGDTQSVSVIWALIRR